MPKIDLGRDSSVLDVNALDNSPQFLGRAVNLDGFSWTALHGARTIGICRRHSIYFSSFR